MPIRINLLAEEQYLVEMRRRDPVKRAAWLGGFVVFLALLWWGSLLYGGHHAKQLMAESGVGPIETALSFNLGAGTISEPAAILIQEALAQIGIKVTINKYPSGQMGQALTKKEVAFYYDGSAAWLADTDYFFRIFYQGDTRWNFGGFENAEMAKLVADAPTEATVTDADFLLGYLNPAYFAGGEVKVDVDAARLEADGIQVLSQDLVLKGGRRGPDKIRHDSSAIAAVAVELAQEHRWKGKRRKS